MSRRSTIALVLLGLTLAGCADPGDDIPPALVELHQRAAEGDAAAQLDLGLRYVTGTGIPPDESAALRWIGQAAAQGRAMPPLSSNWGATPFWSRTGISSGPPACCDNPPCKASPRPKAAWRSCTGPARACRKTGSKPTPGWAWPPNKANGRRWMGSPASRPN